MKNKLLQNLSANTLQLLVNQLAGLVIFYILSTGLNKNSFGQLNLALAILLVGFNLLSFGIEQVSIRKIAAGDDPQSVLSIYLSHVLLTGFIFYGLLLAGSILAPKQNELYPLLLLVGAGKLMIYFSTPFKQSANGMERFKTLSFMLVASNLVRSVSLVVLAAMHFLSLQTTILIFIAGDFAELALSVYLFRRATNVPVTIRWDKLKYMALLRESLPQTGVTILTSAMARFDWIFIGFMASAVKLAEYSFAYKVFEMSTLPLLAIAPLLIPRFTKLFKQDKLHNAGELRILIRAEFIIAALTALVINILWGPVIDIVTKGKYGAVNINTMFILTLCIPFLYLNNFFWTIYFAEGRMKMILKGFVITFIVNAGLDLLLIPFFKNEGAAAAFLASCIVQAAFYISQNKIASLNSIWQNLIITTGCVLVSGFATKMYIQNCYVALLIAIPVFFILLFITSQVKFTDRRACKVLLLYKISFKATPQISKILIPSPGRGAAGKAQRQRGV